MWLVIWPGVLVQVLAVKVSLPDSVCSWEQVKPAEVRRSGSVAGLITTMVSPRCGSRNRRLCCAHALRELAGVAEATWCWASQAADALVAMQHLVSEAIGTGAQRLNPDALATQIHRYRSAAQVGITQTLHLLRFPAPQAHSDLMSQPGLSRSRFTHTWLNPVGTPDSNQRGKDQCRDQQHSRTRKSRINHQTPHLRT
jgi:hypothetical protein